MPANTRAGQDESPPPGAHEVVVPGTPSAQSIESPRGDAQPRVEGRSPVLDESLLGEVPRGRGVVEADSLSLEEPQPPPILGTLFTT